MALATIPGYPRIGRQRELKWALEGHWAGKLDPDELARVAAAVRRDGWAAQAAAGIDLLPVNDFSLYDQMLDACALLGVVPERHATREGGPVSLDTLFAMARGRGGASPARALEMTKWFDTNYHYLVPEFASEQGFALSSEKPFAELAEARALGHRAKPVLVGPLTFLLLGKTSDGSSPLALLDRLLPVYGEVVERLAANGADWIQLDEPVLVQDRPPEELAVLERAYDAIARHKGSARLLVQTYFGHVGEAFSALSRLPVDGIGLDFVRGPENLEAVERHGVPPGMWLAAGVVDGRGVWVNDLAASLGLLGRLRERVPVDRLMVSTSCSLLHVPYDVEAESQFDAEVRPWLAFADQKLAEVALLARVVNDGPSAIAAELDANARVLASRRDARSTVNSAVRSRLADAAPESLERPAKYHERAAAQEARLGLPALPTTTIGSFPQTPALRAARRRHDAGVIGDAEFEETMRGYVRDAVRWQEEVGLDVLVHGEPERNDMVQYFGEQLDGFAFTRNGWVQSYGSRCVRPPIIHGDVSRPRPMTVAWATYAQSLSDRPVKGMLTGPVTILNWSFVREDQPREATCRQIAFALRDEVTDLDAAGIATIQIDEPALREGLPLRRADRAPYLAWATACFRVAASAARAETQVHTHMCYSEFAEIIDAIEALDVDVISIEHARSGNELLAVFRQHGYGKGIGPGVYDIHSPVVPSTAEIVASLHATLAVLPSRQVWVNPDCGLKTRRWEEVRPAVAHLVEAARIARAELGG